MRIRTAAIMAAGWGSRLKELTEYLPKGLLRVGDEPLLGRSVRLLKGAGFEKIIIGTGYCAPVLEDYFAADAVVQCVRMDRYRDVNSMYTLYGMREVLVDDFILLEGDVLYEARAVDELLAHEKSDVILTSEETNADDSVLLETDERGRLITMSKLKSDLQNANHELVGLTKLSHETYQALCAYFVRHLGFHADMYYEEALVEVAAHRPFFTHRVPGLVWCEIDNAEHLERALVEIWPKIAASESVQVVAR